LSASDFEDTKRALETEAALVLAEIEKTTGGKPSPTARQAAREEKQSHA
jgi:hypothetical protein